MAVLRPFKALRPAPAVAEKVAAVPYDVVNREEAAELARGNPLSFLHVSRAEIDLAEDLDPYDPSVYARAAHRFGKLQADGHLIQDDRECLYVYKLRMGEHTQVGVAATYSVDEYDRDRIKKHEKTRKAKEDDRTNHILALRAQTGPVFLTYPADSGIDALIEATMASPPLYDLVAPDSVSHTVWRVPDTQGLVERFAHLPCLYIADGHHRAASASRTRARLRDRERAWKGDEPANYFLAVAFPSDQVQILPYNRVVKDLAGRSPDEFLRALSERLEVASGAAPAPARPGTVSMYLDGKWSSIDLRKALPDGGGPADRLDCAVLQKAVLEGLLRIGDIRTDSRVDFVGGIRGTDELVRLVDSGRWAVAFSMAATTLEQLMAISDAGEIMPPKSTWFEPKLRDGLVSHIL
ncbi:MAG: DUF1015 domain-containing protein [Armatimonadetes bacterium]|nr:DUF1015 domain-containing protein [Armatimonadota bacterium]